MALSDDDFTAATRAGLVMRDPFTRAPEAPESRNAPWPVNDRYPVVIGSGITLQYVSSVLRTCTTGYRREFVDLLNELLERDTHTQGVLTSRIQAVAGGRLEVLPADCDDSERESAEDVAKQVEAALRRIVDLRGAIGSLLWAIYYGVSACEVSWTNDGMWRPSRLHFIHSRRLNFPHPDSWDIAIWDQGQVRSLDVWKDPTSRMFGINPADYPGKFIVFMPQLRGDYPTREGIGRNIVWYMAMKLMGMRGFASSAERFGKPWVLGYYATGNKESGPRVASNDDIESLDLTVRALGAGTASAAALPDSVKVTMERILTGASGENPFHELVSVCNAEISKSVLTQTLTTEAGSKGTRALGAVQERGAMRVAQSDAESIAECLRWQLVATIVRLNWPDKLHLLPKVSIIVEDEPDPKSLVDVAAVLADRGAPVDADALAERVGIPLVSRDAANGRRLVPLSPVAVRDLEALNAGEALTPEESETPPGEPQAAPEDEQDPKAEDVTEEPVKPALN